MTDRARNELKRGIRHKAELATVEELARQIKAAAENLPKAAKEAGIMPGDPMHDVLSTLGTGFASWGDLLTAHAKRLEEMTVAAKGAADSEVTRARAQIGEIEAEAVQRVTEGITEAADRVMERRTTRLEWSLALKTGAALALIMAGMLAGGYMLGRSSAFAEVAVTERQVAQAFQDGPDVAKQWTMLMRNNDLRASMEMCSGGRLLVGKDGRKGCSIPLWTEGPKRTP